MVLLVAIIALLIGGSVNLSYGSAVSQSNSINQTLNQAIASNTLPQQIFFNNFKICLLMFLPLVGAGFGLFTMYSTGVGLKAITTVQGYSVYTGIVNLMMNPIFWLEFAAYSIAMAESIWILRRLIQGRTGEVKWLIISIGICALLLTAGAFIEAWDITGHF
jgi:hypothetical protein